MALASLKSDVQTNDSPAHERPIDLVHLARQSLGDPQLEMEILGMFDQMLCSHFDKLNDDATKDEIEHSLHALKGASAGVGANSVALHAAAMEVEFTQTQSIDSEMLSDLNLLVVATRSYIADLSGK